MDIRNLVITFDPVRNIPALCDKTPETMEKSVPPNAVIPYQEDPETFRILGSKFIRKYLFTKYPIIFNPGIECSRQPTIYKPFYVHKSEEKINLLLKDAVTGETREFSGEIPTIPEFSLHKFLSTRKL